MGKVSEAVVRFGYLGKRIIQMDALYLPLSNKILLRDKTKTPSTPVTRRKRPSN